MHETLGHLLVLLHMVMVVHDGSIVKIVVFKSIAVYLLQFMLIVIDGAGDLAMMVWHW